MTTTLIETLDAAVRDENTVTFTYNGEVRTVAVELVTPTPEKEFVTGYDQDREAIRRFSLSKIENLQVI